MLLAVNNIPHRERTPILTRRAVLDRGQRRDGRNWRSGGSVTGKTRIVPAQVVLYEARDKVVAVVVASLQSKLELDPGLLARLLQQFWLQLGRQKLVSVALVEEYPIDATPRTN